MNDPSTIETMFSNEDAFSQLESIFFEPSEESMAQIERIRGMLDLLPPREADFMDLYFFRHLNQKAIAAIFGVSQPTVCYRLQRATKRIQFLLQLPPVTESEIEEALTEFLPEPIDAQIMVLMWQTTCQSEVAKQLGVTQGLVRHRFIRAMHRIKKSGEYPVLAKMFDVIAENLNILREVRRPAWDGRWTHVID